MTAKAATKPIYAHLYVQVLIGITIGIALGYFWPGAGAAMKPLGDGFIRLIRMIIAPIIFGTVVVGIAKMGDMKNVGRIGLTALIYFEIVSTIALIIGLVVINLLQPGAGINADPATLDASSVKAYASSAQALSATDFVMNIIPATVVGAFASGEILQVLFFSVLFGSRCSTSASEAAAWSASSTRSPTRSSAWSPSSCGSRRLAPLAQWRSPSASTASARCSRSAS